MPLPDRNIPWPPPDTRQPRELYDEWGAWYSGSPTALEEIYRTGTGADPKPHPAQYRGGIVGQVARWWWGTPPTPGQTPLRVHAPAAGDISATSSDMLFGRQPQFRCQNEDAQSRLTEILDDGGAYNALLEAGELCSAYGGVYLRATWDREVADVPLWDALPPDAAAPEFAHGRLRAVTFWRVVAEDDRHVWRHLERHEPGRVHHGLYMGTSDRLGRPMPLQEHPETAGFAEWIDEQGGITTGYGGLAARYVPNMRPHRLIRGSPLGRSDYQGQEPLMDRLDEAWSSWMRDLEIGKGRIVVSEDYLDDHGPGRGASWNPDRQVYSPLAIPHSPDGRPVIEAHQFAIRTAEHSATVRELLAVILRSAGYSLSTFGLREEGEDSAQTATEVNSKRERTQSTTSRKREYWRPELATIAEALLSIDRQILGTRITPERPAVEWPEAEQDPHRIAETVAQLNQAEAASTRTRVRMVHPDWADTDIDTETARIMAEHGRSVPDPAQVGVPPPARNGGTPAAPRRAASAPATYDD